MIIFDIAFVLAKVKTPIPSGDNWHETVRDSAKH